jgi:hypothetical protein
LRPIAIARELGELDATDGRQEPAGRAGILAAVRRTLLLAALLAGLLLGLPGVARADDNLVQPPSLTQPPRGYRLTAQRVTHIAHRAPKVRAVLRSHRRASPTAYTKGPGQWQVSWFSRSGDEIAQVYVDDATGRVTQAWTGFQVAWTMARGYPGAFGRKADALYVWLPLCLLFVLPFVRWRTPLCWLHADLLALLGLSISLAFFNHANIWASVPLVYPFLGYLLVRMVLVGRRRMLGRAPRAAPLHVWMPRRWMLVGIAFLLAFRIGLNTLNSNVIDVGYAGVIGAHKLSHGHQIYGTFPSNNQHGDTYGPFNYDAYVPFEQIWPWSGKWDDLPAAHGAAIVFDVLTLLLLWWLGRRLRGPTLGLALAWGWLTYPFTLFALCSNSNDALVALLLVATLLVSSRPARRGVTLALAGMTKFAPLALGPLFLRRSVPLEEESTPAPASTVGGGHTPRHARLHGLGRALRYCAAFAVVATLCMLPVLLGGHEHVFWQQTVSYQGTRGAPFSFWGLYHLPGIAQHVVQGLVVVFALALAIWPRRRDLVQIAALGAAVLIALQFTVTYWFYLYVIWFFPLVMVALLGRYRDPEAVALSARTPARPAVAPPNEQAAPPAPIPV